MALLEAAGKVSNDDTITSLQKSIKWFQSEALVLDTILEGQKREVQKLKTNREGWQSVIEEFLTLVPATGAPLRRLLETQQDTMLAKALVHHQMPDDLVQTIQQIRAALARRVLLGVFGSAAAEQTPHVKQCFAALRQGLLGLAEYGFSPNSHLYGCPRRRPSRRRKPLQSARLHTTMHILLRTPYSG